MSMLESPRARGFSTTINKFVNSNAPNLTMNQQFKKINGLRKNVFLKDLNFWLINIIKSNIDSVMSHTARLKHTV